MEIKVKNTYYTFHKCEFYNLEGIDILKSYLECCEITSIFDLEQLIYEYVVYQSPMDLVSENDVNSILEDSEDIKVLNMEELITYFKYLINGIK